jgi:hypothetical protein
MKTPACSSARLCANGIGQKVLQPWLPIPVVSAKRFLIENRRDSPYLLHDRKTLPGNGFRLLRRTGLPRKVRGDKIQSRRDDILCERLRVRAPAGCCHDSLRINLFHSIPESTQILVAHISRVADIMLIRHVQIPVPILFQA